ncbi:MAG: NERD domain-containing protein, partial [Oscillospiraceae bacterium]|nr:NERD domain-containing protein [Oscillospiraceae bacterium]
MGLMDLLQNIPTANELNGSFGEYLTKFYSKATTDALVLHDVLIDGADGHTSQIDLILIGHTGIYVVEVKSFTDATIYGDGYKSQWYYYLHGHKYTIYSPLRQNKKHVEYLKTFLQDFGDIPFFSVVVMLCKDFKISNIDPDPENRTTMVCSSLPAMGRALRALSQNRPDVLDDAAKQAVFE